MISKLDDMWNGYHGIAPDIVEYWRTTKYPTLEINTNIAVGGCVVDCTFCPQKVLTASQYSGERVLSLDNFKMVVDKLPKEIRITFSGFTEPWLNKHCTDMLVYAYEQGHEVAAFTTGVGMKPKDVYSLLKVKFRSNTPNGGLVLHLPDKERIAKHPMNSNYIKVIEAFKEIQHQLDGFTIMSMGTVHPDIEHVYTDADAYVPIMWGRAGNLNKEVILKPELAELKYLTTGVSETPMTCNCVEDLYHNVLLPNGNVSLCCEDYNLQHIIGNLFEEEYNEIIPKPNTCFDLCNGCENQKLPSPDMPITFRGPSASKPKELDWGLLAKNEWFMNTLQGEIYDDEVYLKYFDVEIGDVVLDIGASVGPFSHSILNKKPKAIYCVEPHKELFETLSSNLEITGGTTRIHLINSGIACVDGPVVFDGVYDDKNSSKDWTDNPVTANGITLTTLVKKYNIDSIDFLKMDCEGGEYDVFTAGNLDWIKANVRKISGEFHLHNDVYKARFKEFRDLYLKEFANHEILSMDYIDIKHDLWTDWFIEHYNTINLYIDNR